MRYYRKRQTENEELTFEQAKDKALRLLEFRSHSERELTDKLTPSRKERIAKGSGTTMAEVNGLIKQFEQMQKMMKQLSGSMGGKRSKRRGMMRGFGMFGR